jgi:hypothetical protein
MSQQSLLDFLLEDGPAVEDALLANILEEDVPDALAKKTLNRVALLRTQPEEAPQDLSKWKTHRTWAKASVFLAMAAAVLLAVFPPSSGEFQGDLNHMTAKGEQDGAPTITLKIAAIQKGVASRHRTDEAYTSNDEIAFRVQSNKDGFVYLLHVVDKTIDVLLEAPLVAGESDLGMPDGQHARWSFDESDTNSLFAVLSSNEPLQSTDLQDGLSAFLTETPVNKDTLCLAAQSLGCQCDAIEVMVLQ